MSDQELSQQQVLPNHRCPNCYAVLTGPYCSSCGQSQKAPNRFFLTLVNEAFEDVFSFNSRTAKTLFGLLFKPGLLTTEYFAGRRARYIPPLRLYLITSILFFFSLGLQNTFNPNDGNIIYSGDRSEENQLEIDAEINAEMDALAFDFLSPEQNEWLTDKVRTQINKGIDLYSRNPGQIADQLLELIPQVMFFLLPLFALFMKLIYLGSGRFYTEHLVLAVHNHSFLFLALLLLEALELLTGTSLEIVSEPAITIINLWIPLYIYLSLRIFYGDTYLLTLSKYFLLVISYFSLFLLGILGIVLWSLMSI